VLFSKVSEPKEDDLRVKKMSLTTARRDYLQMMVYCLGMETGEIVWAFYTGGTTGIPDWKPLSVSEVVDGIIFVIAADVGKGLTTCKN
jgi:hypothetical protein